MFGPKYDQRLTWMWPTNGQTTDWRLVVKVTAVRPCQSIARTSPSILGSVPEPLDLFATVLAGKSDAIGKRLLMTIPKADVTGIQAGSLAAIAVYQGDRVLGILPLADVADPSSHLQALENWSPSIPT